MHFLTRYLLPRLLQYVLVIFIGVTITFIVPRLTPVNPVEQMINTLTMQGTYMDPRALEQLRESLKEMYGLKGSIFSQYLDFWDRLFKGDFGPSLSQFPTPVIKLIMISLPWTVGLMTTAILISWTLGNIFGGLAGYFHAQKWAEILDDLTMVIRPIPYYVFALIILILFAYIIPLFPLAGGFSVGGRVSLNWKFIADVAKHAFLPALSMVILGTAGWFQTMRLIVSNLVQEDYVTYARVGGLSNTKIALSYVTRNAMLPQITGLALSLGQIFSGALITEIVFSYPGLGGLLYKGIVSGDFNLIMGITVLSIIATATGTFLVDLLYPLFDPRIRYK